MIGNSWWSDVVRRGEEPKLSPPRVIVSISGEPAPQEGAIEWCSALGKPFDASDPPTGTTYVGRCVGKQLFISDVDEKKKKVEALVKIMAPAGDDEPERVIGTFPSRPIKVISKPSKKRQSAKNLECKSSCLRSCAAAAGAITYLVPSGHAAASFHHLLTVPNPFLVSVLVTDLFVLSFVLR